MFNLSLLLHKITTAKQSLRILGIKSPTTKLLIKKQYILLAKKHHPDAADDQGQNKRKKIGDKGESEEYFVQINKAYQFLRDMSEEEINSSSNIGIENGGEKGYQAYQTDRRARMSTEEIKRKQAYDYFNQRRSPNHNLSPGEDTSQQRKPLYKTVPELFVGFLLLAVMLGDWSYRVMKRKYDKNQINQSQNNGKQQKLNQQQKILKAFKSFNHSMIFNANQKDEKKDGLSVI